MVDEVKKLDKKDRIERIRNFFVSEGWNNPKVTELYSVEELYRYRVNDNLGKIIKSAFVHASEFDGLMIVERISYE